MSSKNVQAFDVRPLPVLENALEYVLSFLDSKEQPFEVIHDFIFDRTRSIRQDLSIQNIVNDKAIYMYEEMVGIIFYFVLFSASFLSRFSILHDISKWSIL